MRVVLKNYKLTSLETLISCAAPLPAGVQQMLHKKYNSGGRTVYITQGTPYTMPHVNPVYDADHCDLHRIRHDRIIARRVGHDAFGRS